MLFVDTSVWSLALRRDALPDDPQVQRLRSAFGGGEAVQTTGIVLQELLQGYRGARARAQIVERFAALPIDCSNTRRSRLRSRTAQRMPSARHPGRHH